MRANEIITELRKNPVLNVKTTPSQELERYANDPTIFISYTTLPKLGINPSPTSSQTPGGVYAYPLSMVYDDIKNDITNVPFYKSSVKYIMVFKYLGKILSTDNFSELDFKKALTRLHGWFGKILHQPNVPFHTDDYNMGYESPFNALLEYTKTLALKNLKIPPNNIKFSYDSNEKIIPPIVRPPGYVFTWNTLVKKATGYDAFISTKGTIHGGEPIQAMFLSPEKLQVISMITIPKAKKQGVAEDMVETEEVKPQFEAGPDKASIKSMEKHYSKYKDNDDRTISDYTRGGGTYDSNSQYLNKPLYKAKGAVPKEIQTWTNDTDTLVARHKAPRDITAYYGISRNPKLFSYGSNLIKNNKKTITAPFVFLNYGYTSTSLDPDIAWTFARNQLIDSSNKSVIQAHMLIIKIPKGFSGAYVGHLSSQYEKDGNKWNEMELILPRGTSFTISPKPLLKKITYNDTTQYLFKWKAVAIPPVTKK